jgi:hypothetical protein
MTHKELRKYLLDHYPESRLQLMTDERKSALLAEYPKLPSDYLQFLCEVGFGAIGYGRYSVYGGPAEPSFVFDQVTADRLRYVVLIGDDFAGGQEAFQFRSEGTIFGSIDSLSGRFEPDGDVTFSNFIERWFVERP